MRVFIGDAGVLILGRFRIFVVPLMRVLDRAVKDIVSEDSYIVRRNERRGRASILLLDIGTKPIMPP